jgi:hypothetical protein
MAAFWTLPTGFGELEVLAVGTVLLVEGEPGRTVGEQGPSGFSEPRPQLWSWQGEVPHPSWSIMLS